MEWLSLLSEMLGILFVLHKLLREEFRISRYTVAFLVTEVTIFGTINVMGISPKSQILAYITFILYLLIAFRDFRVIEVFIYAVMSVFIVGGIQIMAYMILFVVPVGMMRTMLANIISLVLIVFVMHYFDWGKICKYIRYNNRILSLVIIFCGFLFIALIISYKGMKEFSFMNCMLIYIIFLLVVVFSQQWKNEREKRLMEARELRVLQQCNESFECLIENVRSKQHEFNNQLEAVYSLQYVCSTYEELVNKQNELVNHISQQNHFNSLLTSNCPATLKGFLYSKFAKAYEMGMEISYTVSLKEVANSLIFDIQEIVGILFDNACEAVEEQKQFGNIRVLIYQTDKDICIRIENPSAYVEQKRFKEFLQKGYSSKGINRGLGLSNVKQIAEKYKGVLSMENAEESGRNWLCVSVKLIL